MLSYMWPQDKTSWYKQDKKPTNPSHHNPSHHIALTPTFHALWCQYGVKTAARLETCYFSPVIEKKTQGIST